MKKIKILIVDDHSILQHGLCNSLEMEKNIQRVITAESGYEAIEQVRECHPDIVIMDISMPGLNGIETTKRILADYPDIKIIALSMHIEKIYVNGMINAGVSGYVLKSCSFKELLDCISRVLADDSYFCQEINHMVDHHDKNHGADKNISVFSLLSRREIEVLQLIAEGYRSRKIADKLNISVKTVDIHRTHLKEKLNIHTIAQLTKFAISEGVTPAHL